MSNIRIVQFVFDLLGAFLEVSMYEVYGAVSFVAYVVYVFIPGKLVVDVNSKVVCIFCFLYAVVMDIVVKR